MDKGGWNPFDWDAFERWLGDSMPFDPRNATSKKINEYVREVVEEALSQAGTPEARAGFTSGMMRPPFGSVTLPTEVFQTHNHVIVRIKVVKGVKPRQLRLYAGLQRLRIDGLPESGTQYVRLPGLVHPETSRAMYRDGVLQVKLPKRKINERFEEVDVRFV